MKNDPLEKLKDIPTLMDEWMCQSRAMSSSEQRAWLISALENCVALGITKGREEVREEIRGKVECLKASNFGDPDNELYERAIHDVLSLSSLNNLTDK